MLARRRFRALVGCRRSVVGDTGPNRRIAVFSMPSGMSVMSAVVTAAAASFLVVI